MEAMRQSWTDDRLDDLVKRVDDGFAQVDRRFAQVDRRFEQVDRRFEQVDRSVAEVRAETKELRGELVAAVEKAQAETKALGNEMNRRFDDMQKILIVALLGGMFTIVAAVLGLLATLAL
jgi:DNA anti-recombination protein RmuC